MHIMEPGEWKQHTQTHVSRMNLYHDPRKCILILVASLEITFCALTASFWNQGSVGAENVWCLLWIVMAHLHAFAIYVFQIPSTSASDNLQYAKQLVLFLSTLMQGIFVLVVLYSVLTGLWETTSLTAVAITMMGFSITFLVATIVMAVRNTDPASDTLDQSLL